MQRMQVNNLIVGANCAVDFNASRVCENSSLLSQLSYMVNTIFLVEKCRSVATGQRFSWQGRLALLVIPPLCLKGLKWGNLISEESAICNKYIPEYLPILYRGAMVVSMVAFAYFGYPLVCASFSIYTAIQFGFLGKMLQDFSATLNPYINLLMMFVVEDLMWQFILDFSFFDFLVSKYYKAAEERFSDHLTEKNLHQFSDPGLKLELNQNYVYSRSEDPIFQALRNQRQEWCQKRYQKMHEHLEKFNLELFQSLGFNFQTLGVHSEILGCVDLILDFIKEAVGVYPEGEENSNNFSGCLMNVLKILCLKEYWEEHSLSSYHTIISDAMLEKYFEDHSLKNQVDQLIDTKVKEIEQNFGDSLESTWTRHKMKMNLALFDLGILRFSEESSQQALNPS